MTSASFQLRNLKRWRYIAELPNGQLHASVTTHTDS